MDPEPADMLKMAEPYSQTEGRKRASLESTILEQSAYMGEPANYHGDTVRS